jgi:hypothetical protein
VDLVGHARLELRRAPFFLLKDVQEAINPIYV